MEQKQEVVAIDGPVGVGKSTLGKLVAKRLKYIYVDTGALYRAIGWEIYNMGIDPEDVKPVVEALPRINVTLNVESGEVWVNGKNATPHLRTPLMSRYSSMVSAISEVRKKLLSIQKELAQKGRAVMDGRDIGTVIAPNARYKFYIDASPDIRADRRCKELGANANFEDVLREVKERDKADSTRKESPLRKARDALYIDTSMMTIEEVTEKMLDVVENTIV